ncbi:hypothetical protein, conserved [Angomonas deanei]|uniref:Uncharacterized protein n=1 Tax=Angomonas deanei TaxID=59799 RepID=A0A7G2CBM5_9TRYP|nr:hypothetical protein, conserved [Angomonas deanei]
MHENIRKVIDDIKQNNNVNSCVHLITKTLQHCPNLPKVVSGRSIVYPDVTTFEGKDGEKRKDGTADGLPERKRNLPSMLVGSGPGGLFNDAVSGAYADLPSERPSNTASGPKNAGASALNGLQVCRLLLLRAECFDVLKSYEHALYDTLTVIEIGKGQLPEAYYMAGRAYMRLYRINEAQEMYDTAEVILSSIRQTVSRVTVTNVTFDTLNSLLFPARNVGTKTSPPTKEEPRQPSTGNKAVFTFDNNEREEDFWALRGFTMDDVRQMGLTKEHLVAQERHAAATARRGSRPQPMDETPKSPNGEGSFSARAQQNSNSSFGLTPADNARVTVCESKMQLLQEELIFQNYGIGGVENAMWREQREESHALVRMSSAHAVPNAAHHTATNLLSRRVGDIRGSATFAINNNTCYTMKLIGCVAPDAQYTKNFTFPTQIPKFSCGLGLLQPRSWGGYSAMVCYEVQPRLCCFFYFDSPLIGNGKVGVRFTNIPADALYNAMVEYNHQQNILDSTRNANYNPKRQGGTSFEGTPQVVEAAQRATRVPPPQTWIPSHTANLASQGVLKASSQLTSMNGANVALYALSQVLAIQLRPVESLLAIQYGGGKVVKKLSMVNHYWRRMTGHLPPPLLADAPRYTYPDYILPGDLQHNPWVVRDQTPVRWRLQFEGRAFDHEDFSISEEHHTGQWNLFFNSDSQSRVASTVCHGSRTAAFFTIKESWVPFSNTLYLNTMQGRTFASLHNDTSSNTFRVLIPFVGAANNKGDVFYIARRSDINVPGNGAKITKGSVVTSADTAKRVIQGKTMYRSSPGVSNTSLTGIAESSSTTGANNEKTSSTPTPLNTAIIGEANNTNSNNNSTALPLPPYMQHCEVYSVWRPNRYSGAVVAPAEMNQNATTNNSNVVLSPKINKQTNHGEVLVAEIRLVPASMTASTKGMCLSEVTLFPGADALLVSTLAFAILRW